MIEIEIDAQQLIINSSKMTKGACVPMEAQWRENIATTARLALSCELQMGRTNLIICPLGLIVASPHAASTCLELNPFSTPCRLVNMAELRLGCLDARHYFQKSIPWILGLVCRLCRNSGGLSTSTRRARTRECAAQIDLPDWWSSRLSTSRTGGRTSTSTR